MESEGRENPSNVRMTEGSRGDNDKDILGMLSPDEARCRCISTCTIQKLKMKREMTMKRDSVTCMTYTASGMACCFLSSSSTILVSTCPGVKLPRPPLPEEVTAGGPGGTRGDGPREREREMLPTPPRPVECWEARR